MVFKAATRTQALARVAIDGPSGSGKSMTALRLAWALAQGGRIAAIDTEHESLSKYALESREGEGPYQFDSVSLAVHSPDKFIECIQEADRQNYSVLIIDSLSHSWIGKNGALELVDRAASRDPRGNTFQAWGQVTPQYRALIDAIVRCRCHVVATLRSKTEYVIERDARGRSVPRKIGTTPVIREGIEYEFDLVASMDLDHGIRVHKSRCDAMQDAQSIRPGAVFWRPLIDWLSGGSPLPVRASQEQLVRLRESRDRLFHALGCTTTASKAAPWTELLQSFGVQQAADLTAADAQQLIDIIEAQIVAAETAEPQIAAAV